MDFSTTSAHMMCELGQIAWSAVPQFPYLWIQAFTICLLISTEILQGTNSITHVQVLCKIKSYWLLNVACPQFMPGPAFFCVKGAKGGYCRNQPSQWYQPLPLCHPKFCQQETSAFANLTIKKNWSVQQACINHTLFFRYTAFCSGYYKTNYLWSLG